MARVWLLAAGLLGAGLLGRAAAEGLVQFGVPALSRRDFNRMAQRRDSPLFWRYDQDRDRLIDPEELVVVGLSSSRAPFVKDDEFTHTFVKAYRQFVDLRRRQAVRRELAAGRPTLVHADLRQLPLQEKRMVRHVLQAARLVDRLYYRQRGAARYLSRLHRLDPASRALFRRNNGPWCVAPLTRDDPFCHALPDFPQRRSENYPTDLVQDEALCRRLQAHQRAKQLLDPFTVVRQRAGTLVAVPMTRAYASEARAIATKLQLAARELEEVPEDKALREYLLAAGRAFETNAWRQADAAWVAASAANGRWYLRVAPDEVYQDLCQRKAAFHLVLGRVDPRLVEWKQRLTPLRQEMERLVAALLGRGYRARRVAFAMPDFVQVVLNAGDSRHPLGATIGQSLPNWGRIARQGRGRTVVMTNLYTDADSRWVARQQAESLLDSGTLAYFSDSSDPSVLVTILHEASHNLGPHSDFAVRGQSPAEIFGGQLATVLEELKAQSMGLWFLELLQRRGLLSERETRQAYTKALMWAFGHLSRGLKAPSGGVRPYSQLAAVQLAHLSRVGALRYDGDKFSLDYERLPGALAQLAQRVGRLKAAGDAEAGRHMLQRHTSAEALRELHAAAIRREMLRYPKASFRYAVTL